MIWLKPAIHKKLKELRWLRRTDLSKPINTTLSRSFDVALANLMKLLEKSIYLNSM